MKLRGLKNKTFRFNNSALIDANLLSRSICKHVAAENQFIHISNWYLLFLINPRISKTLRIFTSMFWKIVIDTCQCTLRLDDWDSLKNAKELIITVLYNE